MVQDAPVPALRDDGSLDLTYSGVLTPELGVALYEQMVLARALDERAVALQREGIVASHASGHGEEAAIVGAAAAMQDDDWLFPSSRELAAALWRGMPIGAYAHHLLGSARDVAHGRNAPDPPFWKAARVASVSPLAGTQIPHAVGLAWAARTRKDDVVSLVYFGEGATSTHDFHAAMNFAGVTRAPVVFLCRNNGRAVSLPAYEQTASASFAVKAVAYGLRGVVVDGTDVVAVLAAVREARALAADGEGGTLVEAAIGESDPVARMRRYLVTSKLWDGSREEQLQTEVRADVERAVAAALEADPPSPNTLQSDVFANPKEPRS